MEWFDYEAWMTGAVIGAVLFGIITRDALAMLVGFAGSTVLGLILHAIGG